MNRKHPFAPYFVLLLGLNASGADVATPPQPPAGVTLRQCYAWAVAQSENLKIRQEDINQSSARSRSALGGAFPYLDWQFTDTWQDPKGVDTLDRQGFGGFVAKEQVDSKLSLKQPLF